MYAENFGLRGDRITDKNRGREPPILAEEDGTGPGQVFGHKSMKQAGRQAALQDSSSWEVMAQT